MWGDHAAAAKEFEKADTNDLNAMLRCARFYERKGDLARAKSLIANFLKTYPGHAEANLLMGSIYARSDNNSDRERGKRLIRKSMRLDRDFGHVFYCQGFLASIDGQRDAAFLSATMAALAGNLNAIEVLMKMARDGHADPVLISVLENAGNKGFTRLNSILGELYFKLGDFEKAEEKFLLALAADDEQAYIDLLSLYLEPDKRAAGLSLVLEAIKSRNPVSPEIIVEWTMRAKAAREVLPELIARAQTNPRLLLFIAYLYRGLGEEQAAVECFCILISYFHLEPQFRRIKELTDTNQHREAIKELRALLTPFYGTGELSRKLLESVSMSSVLNQAIDTSNPQ